jgi:hypothetical protein
MPRTNSTLLYALILLGGTSTGCNLGLRGQWELREAHPHRDVFAIDHLILGENGTFSATITREGHQQDVTGSYQSKPLTLELWPSIGGYERFNYKLRGDTLSLSQSEKRLILQRRSP